jgi:hypothetical protein
MLNSINHFRWSFTYFIHSMLNKINTLVALYTNMEADRCSLKRRIILRIKRSVFLSRYQLSHVNFQSNISLEGLKSHTQILSSAVNRHQLNNCRKQFNCKHKHSSRVVLRESENEFTVILQIMPARYPHHCVLWILINNVKTNKHRSCEVVMLLNAINEKDYFQARII